MTEGSLSLNLIERETGTLSLSIGTALAFESLLGIHPDQVKNPINVKTVNQIWVNLYTLVRNLYSAVPTDKINSIDLNAAIEVLISELEMMKIILEQRKLNIEIIPYASPKDEIEYVFPKAEYKQAKTPKQVAYKYLEDYIVDGLINILSKEHDKFTMIRGKPKRLNVTALLLTHFPHELFWKDQFDRLLLLESHTGRIKPYNLWYTKLHGIKSTDRPLPFTRFTLQVFGDGVLIDGQSRNIKAQLKQLAETRRWSPVTTPDKLYHDLTTYGTKELVDCYKKLR